MVQHERGVTEIKLLVFALDDEEFAVDILKVQEVITLQEITHLPRTPDFIEGVINLRGKIIPVISLRKRFGLPSAEGGEDARIVILEISGRSVGLVVDLAREVVSIPARSVQPPPPNLAGVRTDLIEGVGREGERLFVLLNLESILSTEEKIALGELAVR